MLYNGGTWKIEILKKDFTQRQLENQSKWWKKVKELGWRAEQ
eukprot:COSAG01_NODE_11900_length_1837_cov_168.412543_3_plen_42_part_00